MNYENAFKILDTNNFSGFSQQTSCSSCAYPINIFPGDPNGYVDPSLMFELRWNAIKYCGGGLSGIICMIINFADAVGYFIKAWWQNFSQMLFKRSRDWWDHFLETFKGIAWDVSSEFKAFVRDPVGTIWNGIKGGIASLIEGVKTGFKVTWDFAYNLWSYLQGFVQPLIESLKNTIINWITDRVNAIRIWLNETKDILSSVIKGMIPDIRQAIKDTQEVFSKPIVNIQNALEDTKNVILKTFDFGLGGLINTFKDFLSGLWDKAWEWFTNLIGKVASFLNERFFQPIWNLIKDAWSWLVSIFSALWREVKDLFFSLAPSAPERGEDLMVQGLKLLGVGVGAFGALTGLSMAVSWLSKHHLGHLSAILYDMSSYKYIAGALFGGLVTAAYAQPLKYYYNAVFRPYLPRFSDVLDALGRSIISPDVFKFILKYEGISEKYADMYQRLAARPVSPFMIRYIADAEITDPQGIFAICMDCGYSVEHAAYMAYAMSWGANASYRKDAEKVIRNCFKEGFIDKSRMDQAISEIRSTREVPVSYKTIDGLTYSATIRVPLDQKTLMKITSEWEAFYDSMYDKVSALKSAYATENISEEEFRSGLRNLGIVENKIEDIVSREKAKKKAKTEPDKGKSLRSELKSVLTRCYKEGFITAEYLDELIEESNKIVDEEELIKQRANWEAFYDDMVDLVNIYKTNLENGIIEEDEFRRDLIDLGLRPEKVELMIKYTYAKKTGRIKKK